MKGNNPSNFWFGFILGGGSVLFFAWLLGTKSGREFFKKIFELSEDWEKSINYLLKKLEEEDNLFSQLKIKPAMEKKELTSLPEVVNKIKNRLTF